MSIQHKHSEGPVAPVGKHLQVRATTTFKAAILGVEMVQFKRGEIYPRAFTQAEVGVYLNEKPGPSRLVEVTPAELKKIAEEAATKAKAAQTKAPVTQPGAPGGQNAHSNANGGASGQPDGNPNAQTLPDEKALDAMLKADILAQAEKEGAQVAETMSKAQIKAIILDKRSAV